MRYDQEMNGSDVIEWIRLSMRSGIDRMPKDIADVMENAIRCIEDVWRRGPSSPFASILSVLASSGTVFWVHS